MTAQVDYQKVWDNAVSMGRMAAQIADAALGDENSRGLDCGFAWVTIRPARGAFVSWLKKHGHGHNAYGGGWEIWYSEFSDGRTQSISVHEAAAKAFRDSLVQDLGISPTVGSRYD